MQELILDLKLWISATGDTSLSIPVVTILELESGTVAASFGGVLARS